MSRIGRMHITVPAGVTVDYKDNLVTVKGPKGTLTQKIATHAIDVKVDGNVVTLVITNLKKPSPCTVFTECSSQTWSRA